MATVNPKFAYDSFRTVTLLVEDTKFWVPGDTLAAYSPHFKYLLKKALENYTPDQGIIIPLPGKKAKEIEELLLCLIPTPTMKPIDDSNTQLMLEMALNMDIPELKARVDAFLLSKMHKCKSGDPALLDILPMASGWSLKSVLQPCLKRCALEFEMEKLESACEDLPKSIIQCMYLYKKLKPAPQWDIAPFENISIACKSCNNITKVSHNCKSCDSMCCVMCTKNHACKEQPEIEEDEKMQEIMKFLLDHAW